MPDCEGTTSQSPKLKRQRTDTEDCENKSDEPSRDTRFWFEDGNIVLQAQNTQFRVHRGVIARHSCVFSDMLGLAHPEPDTVEECPVVSMTDTPDDWTHILSIFYDNEITYQTATSLPLPLLGAMLRLGRKYQFDKLHTSALTRLKRDIPTTLDMWDRLLGDSPCIKDGFNAFDLVNLLEEMGINTLLPVAYYICIIKHDLDDLFNGISGHDDSVTLLSPLSVQRVVKGRETLSRTIVRYKIGSIANPTGDRFEKSLCSSCVDLRTDFFRDHCKSPNSLLLPKGEVFFPQASDIVKGSCRNCMASMRIYLEDWRKVMWNRLPGYFGLPVWKNLIDT